MIAYLEGIFKGNFDDHVIVDVNGIGYKVFVPTNIFTQLPSFNEEIKLFTHLHIREDAHTLYGFLTTDEKNLFELVLSVSGVGPKVALNIMSTLGVNTFVSAILKNDLAVLTSVPNVGSKLAHRLVLELKDKIAKVFSFISGDGIKPVESLSDKVLRDALDALVALGYNQREAKTSLAQVQKEEDDSVEVVLKKALKYL
jgi:Holliday junction DNA helicase RuvA